MSTHHFFTFTATRIILGLIALAAITGYAASANVIPGKTVTLTGNIAGAGPFSYQWYKDGVPIPGANGSTYEIHGIKAVHAGEYYVVISNKEGSTNSEIAKISLSIISAAKLQPDSLPGPIVADNHAASRLNPVLAKAAAAANRTADAVARAAGLGADTLAGTGQAPAVRSEFRAEALSKILWYDQATGEFGLRLMTAMQMAVYTLFGVPASEVEIDGAGDLEPNAHGGIVWQNDVTGETGIWQIMEN